MWELRSGGLPECAADPLVPREPRSGDHAAAGSPGSPVSPTRRGEAQARKIRFKRCAEPRFRETTSEERSRTEGGEERRKAESGATCDACRCEREDMWQNIEIVTTGRPQEL